MVLGPSSLLFSPNTTHFPLRLHSSLALVVREVQNCVHRTLVATSVAYMLLHRLSVSTIVGFGEGRLFGQERLL